MKCPNCNETLVMAERHGVEIDYCPNCRGVWLDKGELDKILDKAADNESRYTNNQPDTHYENRDRRDYSDKDDPRYRRKKKGFLGDFFDFD